MQVCKDPHLFCKHQQKSDTMSNSSKVSGFCFLHNYVTYLLFDFVLLFLWVYFCVCFIVVGFFWCFCCCCLLVFVFWVFCVCGFFFIAWILPGILLTVIFRNQ